jgi:hypothetical protein
MSVLVGQLEPLADLLKAISATGKSSPAHEPAEVWAEPIELDFMNAGTAALQDANRDVAKIAAAWQFQQRMQHQRADLRLLVHQHYVSRLTPEQQAVFWSVPQGTARRWHELGLLGPTTPAKPLRETLDQMAAAARLGDVLQRRDTYPLMRQMAQQNPTDGVEILALRIANETLASAIEKMAARHGDTVSDVFAQEQRKEYLHLLGNVPNTAYGKNVRVRLAGSLADLFRGQDFRREWERAAVTTTRYAYNLGLLARLRHNGTNWLAYNVHPDACEHCKKLLLYPDGFPRIFAVQQIWTSIAEDGGMNIGRKANRIGRADGWRATVIIHPFCRCSPRRALAREVQENRTRGNAIVEKETDFINN